MESIGRMELFSVGVEKVLEKYGTAKRQGCRGLLQPNVFLELLWHFLPQAASVKSHV